MRLCIYLLFCVLTMQSCQQPASRDADITPLKVKSQDFNFSIKKIAFGSCNHEEDPQNYWQQIAEEKADLWIWMGDIIYADTKDMDKMAQRYKKQKSNIFYRQFADSTPVIGVWDDHDYGVNDGNRLYEKKAESKAHLFDFLDVPEDATSRMRAGAYQAYNIGNDQHKIKFILLDTRSFQDPLHRNTSGVPRYKPSEGDLLGEAQWQWLEKELSKEDTRLNIIISSIQFVADDQIYEKWGNFPKSKNRMLRLLQKYNATPAIILSGDRHLAEISRVSLENYPYPLYDITSSGLTHSFEQADEENQFRISPLISVKNYGVLEFNWQDSIPQVMVHLKSISGESLFTMDLKL